MVLGTLPRTLLVAKNPRDLSWAISFELARRFAEVHGKRSQIDISSIFMRKQSNLVKIFKEIIIDHITNDNSLTSAQKQSLITQTLIYIGSSLTSERIESLRGLFESFVGSGSSATLLELPIFNPANPKVNYKIPIYINDFIGQNINMWGTVGKTLQKNIAHQKFNIIRDINVKRITNHLMEEIQGVGGHVRILPVFLTNKYGFKANVPKDFLLPTVSGTEPNSFIIDLRDTNSIEYTHSEYIVKHMAFLLHSQPLGFAVIDISKTFDDNEAYFFLTIQGYLRGEEILSLSGGTGRVYRLEHYTNLPSLEVSFYDILEKHNEDWRNAWEFSIYMTSGSRSQFNTYYMNWLKSSMDPMAVHLRRVLGWNE